MNFGISYFIALHSSLDHLEIFRSTLKSTHPVYFRCHRSDSPTSASISIKNRQLTSDLISQGVVIRKTYNLRWPTHLRPALVRHYIRGYNDGDGGFYFYPPRTLSFQVTSTKSFLLGLQEHLEHACRLNPVKLQERDYCFADTYTLSYGGRQIERIFDYLYNEATVWLPRKREVIEEPLRSLPRRKELKFTPEVLADICRRYSEEGVTSIDLAQEFDIHPVTMRRLLSSQGVEIRSARDSFQWNKLNHRNRKYT